MTRNTMNGEQGGKIGEARYVIYSRVRPLRQYDIQVHILLGR